MAVKCTECGASIQDDSKFCKYCGAKIVLDQTKKIEIKIDNTAEVRRASYEEEESKIRQKAMKRELRMKGLKWKICGGIFLAGLLMALPDLISGGKTSTVGVISLFIVCGVPAFIFIDWITTLMK
jgi:DNA-directed RNA polymerase subunit RPC12/RpoP